MSTPNPDREQAQRFLIGLANGKPATFQTFSDREELKRKLPSGKLHDPNARILHGTLEQYEGILEGLNTKGAGVYVMVNAGDGRGRSAHNVVRVRALFIDTDGTPLPTSTKLQPHLKVQSSPSKWHLYWLVTGLEPSNFATLQKALAEHYGTDPAVHDLPRVMRLPGFYHRKGEPVMVQLLEAYDHPPYTPADVFSAWPFLSERLERQRTLEVEKKQRLAELLRLAAERRAAPQDETSDRDRSRALKLLGAHYERVANAGDGTRHETLKESAYTLGGYVGGGYLERDEVEDELTGAAETCGLPDGEAADLIRWGLDNGAEKPLELTDPTGPRFGAMPSFGATGRDQNIMRPTQAKPCLGHSGTYREGLGIKPRLGGKPCL